MLQAYLAYSNKSKSRHIDVFRLICETHSLLDGSMAHQGVEAFLAGTGAAVHPTG